MKTQESIPQTYTLWGNIMICEWYDKKSLLNKKGGNLTLLAEAVTMKGRPKHLQTEEGCSNKLPYIIRQAEERLRWCLAPYLQ